ncbi:hypothetical protein [Nonomuraea wenchangensis]|uniref:hypothetical protein n=1 Tax=Nonomuraea wenchangensis TaxID=568860 RepID=UPI00331CC0A2
MTVSAQGSPAGHLARELAAALEGRGIDSQVFEAQGIALVGIWSVGLVVWCEPNGEAWRSRWSLDDGSGTGRRSYAVCTCAAMETAVRRIEGLYRERYRRMYGEAGPEVRRPHSGEGGRG